MKFALLLLGALLALPAAVRADDASGPTPEQIKSRVDAVEASLGKDEDRLKFVEAEYVERKDASDAQVMSDRFAKGAGEFLEQDYPGASVLFYDLVGMPDFKASPNYDDALYYLAESLYQQQNYLGARTYFRELLNLHRSHYREALARYLELSGRLNVFTGIEQYVEGAREGQGGLPPEIAYVYGKWLFRRTDLSLAERAKRAIAVFGPLADGDSQYRLQARYFVGVLQVQQGNYDEAMEAFGRIAGAAPRDGHERTVQELAHLAMGRIAYEQSKYAEAIDQYQEIDRESENFVPALYEIAWVFVKKGDFEKALKAADLLLLIAPDSTIAPEAKILEGHLYLKLGKYADSSQTYKEVINTYAPVRDEVDALLKLHDDPVKYFDDLLAQNEKSFDVTSLLPPVAARWATTQQEVAEALRMTSDLAASRRGVDESDKIAQAVLKGLQEKGANAFPILQEGFSKAEAVDAALTHDDQELLSVEQSMLGGKLGPLQAQLDAARREREALEEKFQKLPKTESEVEQRRDRNRKRLADLDRAIFLLQTQVDGLNATLNAIEKWVVDTRAQRHDDPEAEKQFLDQVKGERGDLADLGQALSALHDTIKQVQLASGNVSADEQVRAAYQEALEREQDVLSRARSRLGPGGQQLADRIDRVRRRVSADRARVASAKVTLRAAVAAKAEGIRNQVLAEQEKLRGYSGEADNVSADARNLVGRIAFDSFKRVRKQFYDLVLKADVGMIDVAWTKKQDDTHKIQQLSKQKDRELKGLDDEFKEVLKDVD